MSKPQLNSNREYIYLTRVDYPFEEGDDVALQELSYQKVKIKINMIEMITENSPDLVGNTVIYTLADEDFVVMENYEDIDKIHEWYNQNKEKELIVKNSN